MMLIQNNFTDLIGDGSFCDIENRN
jgi:hypothetical protein